MTPGPWTKEAVRATADKPRVPPLLLWTESSGKVRFPHEVEDGRISGHNHTELMVKARHFKIRVVIIDRVENIVYGKGLV